MVAFVNSVGLSAVSRPALPQSGLQAACGTTAPTASRPVAPASLRMGITPIDQSYTLQTLTYEPTPVISGVEDKDLICYRVWRQVFGNAYVMDSERADAYKCESMYRAGMIPLREFVRGVALSATYRRRFFECCSPCRAVELNFKHLLGRAPVSQAEVSKHVQLITNEGFEAEINSYIDSLEYEEAFGNDYVPYVRYKGTYATIEEFNRMCTINSAAGTSDKSLTMRGRQTGVENPNHVLSLDGAGTAAKLVSNVATNGNSAYVPIKRALPMRPDLEHGQDASATQIDTTPAVNDDAVSPRRRVEISMGNYMYLTPEEAAAYAANTLDQKKITSLAETEIMEAQEQMEALQAKVDSLKVLV